ncbi:sucrose-phosphatase-like HAD superfamily hydrolase [Reticulomyxa filosa]|uniref:Sucrose-phosphatase-like HAD superfamily hydrolase n=1 Tax=Reticulomyxa filosa TaxID=46433 RepID=X6NN56_RETFI|nr:sucrose-phosphatase-like HAD superfamily hydrolase [Reticulomyxa filosa]|eukprot:ETO26827.1 sucrose-phosphatase-like HAD superfamily hydrolase [Reticulomyxa filosa]
MIPHLTKYGKTILDQVHHKFPLKLPPRLVLITDLDHTLLGVSANESMEQAQANLQVDFFISIKNKYAPNNSILVYATGRSMTRYEMATKEYPNLLKPDILICKDGVEIFWFNKHLAQLVQEKPVPGFGNSIFYFYFFFNYCYEMKFDNGTEPHQFLWLDRGWDATLQADWNQEFAESLHHEWKQNHKLAALPAGSDFLEPFRIAVMTFTMEEAISAQEFFLKRVEEYNLQIEKELNAMSPLQRKKSTKHPMKIHAFYCIERASNNWWACICPAHAGKGCAVEWIRKRLHHKNGENFVVCGDSGNDISMLSLPNYHAVIVRNCSRELQDYYEAHGELKGQYMYLTKANRTHGVMEGLEYFGHRISKSWTISEN